MSKLSRGDFVQRNRAIASANFPTLSASGEEVATNQGNAGVSGEEVATNQGNAGVSGENQEPNTPQQPRQMPMWWPFRRKRRKGGSQ